MICCQVPSESFASANGIVTDGPISAAHVAGSVVVAAPQMVAILTRSRCEPLEQLIHIGDRARLEFDRRHRGGRSNDENGDDAGRDV
jgi:hypothetical protein